MWVGRLVALIEDHADELAKRLVRKVREDPRTAGYDRFDDQELARRARAVYSDLGRWLGKSSEDDIEQVYSELGRVRRGEGIPLSQVVMALLITRRNLWHYVDSLSADTILELRQQFDLEIMVVRFYDRAIYHAVRGYEAGSDE